MRLVEARPKALQDLAYKEMRNNAQLAKVMKEPTGIDSIALVFPPADAIGST